MLKGKDYATVHYRMHLDLGDGAGITLQPARYRDSQQTYVDCHRAGLERAGSYHLLLLRPEKERDR